ncbi:MAG: energy-coupling factor transporter transmembrane protein EcfT [Armatimonadetes bacterium]|nr:energy-coupling factor transporter transmembrane protein EcfT [Armatimonadota bacterium]
MTNTVWLLLGAGLVAAAAGLSFSRSFFSGHAGLGVLEPIDRDGPLHRLPARIKLLAVITLALLSAFIPAGRLAVPALLVLGAVLAARVPLGRFLGRLGELVPFVLLAVLGVALRGDTALLAVTLGRAVMTVMALTLLVTTTSVPALVQAARQLGLPDLLGTTLALALRYLSLLCDEGSRLSLAFQARAVGPRDLRLARPLGRMVGSLAVRSLERGERVHQAMLARGFDGHLPSLSADVPARWRHWVGLAAWVAALGAAAWPNW